ncbi:MAG: deoxyribodipyrimidine photolyase, partial [Cyanobacteria bacterium K_DeepCast_35m_m2_023]|nr:deoxyribodipyrimidine photolyase [Cyanobacteria bacterium K_DeepCast_35m_m2_023]
PWHEWPQFGVVRRLKSRNGWARRWQARMDEAVVPQPLRLTLSVPVDPGPVPNVGEVLDSQDHCPLRQRGGRAEGLLCLESFLQQRSRNYQSGLSSPLSAVSSCSRLSAHLSWGTLSLREVVQASGQRRTVLSQNGDGGRWPLALQRFEERLHWHCHFIQKLEDQPSLEFEELHPQMAGLREPCPERLSAWASGTTGLPFVDACMRSLIASGWLNFRMRAMLMSVASYQLWLPWRHSGLHLARLFVDYEPGIHWSQCQMQSGTTGINTLRIYNPIKQALDHDPTGQFVRRWLPELAKVPAVHLHQPWLMDRQTEERSGCILGSDYPLPIVDWQQAAAVARDRLWALRREDDFAQTADEIQERHGSRRSGLRPGRRERRTAPGSGRQRRGLPPAEQLSLDFGDAP